MMCRKREQDVVNTKQRKDARDDASIAQEEEVYEKQSRSDKQRPQVDVVDLLPFKSADGTLVYDKSRTADTLAMVCSYCCAQRGCFHMAACRGGLLGSAHVFFCPTGQGPFVEPLAT